MSLLLPVLALAFITSARAQMGAPHVPFPNITILTNTFQIHCHLCDRPITIHGKKFFCSGSNVSEDKSGFIEDRTAQGKCKCGEPWSVTQKVFAPKHAPELVTPKKKKKLVLFKVE